MLPAEVRGRFRVVLAGNLLGNEKPQTLDVQMGDVIKNVPLNSKPTTFQLDYDLPSAAQAILGLSNDFRLFGFEIEKLDRVMAAGQGEG